MAQLTKDDVVATLGRIDDGTIAQIIATGATKEELAEARAWVANEEPLMNAGRPRAAGRVGRLVDLLCTMQEDEEALLERGAP